MSALFSGELGAPTRYDPCRRWDAMASKKKTIRKKSAVRKPAAKKTAAKKPPAKKAVAKKAPAKKAPAKKKAAVAKSPARKAAAKKVPAKKAPAKKATVKKAPAKTKATAKKTPSKQVSAPAQKRTGKHLTAKELRHYQQLLLNLRDRVIDEISFLAGDNLNSVQMERKGEEGTDNFNREFALKLVSSEQDIIYEIDEALRRMRHGTYGICEISGEPIEKERLKVMPHARHSVKVQSELEKGRARYRPFGPSISRS